MESSRNKKRGYEQSVEDEADGMPGSKKSKLPALASVIVEALKMDSLQRLCSSLEPLLRRIVSEEVERALTKFGHAKLAARSPPPRIHGPGEKNLQLHFKTRMPPHLFTGGKVEGDQGAAIQVVLIDMNTGDVVQTGPESSAKLNVVVLEGDFNEEEDDDWTKEHFESHEVKERQGKRPILTGDLLVTLKEGFGTLGDLTFTDNSSWIRSRKFRLGLKVSPGYCDGIRVREAKTEGFAVKDHRGELYKKHYPPALHDEVWRLDRIAKDGALHKKLMKADIVTVEDFLRILVRDPQKLRNILGSGMSNRMWENTVEHAKTCVLGGKLYVYYADGTQNTGVVFNNIYELQGLIDDGQFVSLESLTHSQKILVDSSVKRAYDNWHRVLEYDGKFLSSLTDNTKKAIKSSPAPTVSSNYDTGRCTSTTQSRQQYMSSEPRSQYQSGNHQHAPVTQLIEFPFVRPDQTSLMILNNPQAALSGSFDHLSVGNAAAGGSYFPGDWSRPRNGHGLEDFLAEEIRVRSSEMLENDDMQRLLKTLSMGMTAGYDHSHEACYSYGIQYETPMDENLVNLYGCCVEGNHRILVYNYLENNSLAQTLIGGGHHYSNIQFSWRTRSRICIGIARGLAFLHEEVRPHIIHRDIKASNILLDKDLTPKISDFGLAKLIPANMTHVSTRVAGTIGYLAPEYAIRGQVTRKADIYSFGVLLVEIVSGRCNTNMRLPAEEQYLLERTWDLYERRELILLVDTSLNGDFDAEEACTFLKVGLLCTQDTPKLRPSMSTVVKMLMGEKDIDDDKITKPGLISDFMDLKVRGPPKPNLETTTSSAYNSSDNPDNSNLSSAATSAATMTFTVSYDRST